MGLRKNRNGNSPQRRGDAEKGRDENSLSAVLLCSSPRLRVSAVKSFSRSSFIDLLARDARGLSLHQVKHFGQRGHGGIARGGHSQRAVSGAAFHGPLRRLAGEKTVDEAGSETGATADAVVDFEILAVLRFVKSAVGVTQRAPIVAAGGGGLS